MHRITVLTPIALWMLVACAAAPAQQTPAELYDHAEQAAVEVLINGRLEGSGWFAAPDGHIVTAGHAVQGRTDARIEIISPVAGRRVAKFVALDRGHDLALLKIDAGEKPYPYLDVADRMPAPGEDVYLYAAANFRHNLMLAGKVARRDPTYEYLSTRKQYIRIYHVSAPSPPGTSGGCWLNQRGQVVGNQSAFMTVDGSGAGIAMLATPDAIAALIESKTTTTPTTFQCAFEELWTQNTDYIARYPQGIGGLVPVQVQEDGVAQKAGLSGELLITAVDGKPTPYKDQMLDVIRAKQPGDSVTLNVIRIGSGERDSITLELAGLK